MKTKHSWARGTEAEENQAYANGISAGQYGPATNPYRWGTKAHKAWRLGYSAGKRLRYK